MVSEEDSELGFAAPAAARSSAVAVEPVKTTFSPELQALLDQTLDTLEKLEVVLALRAAGKPLSLAELALQLQVGQDVLRRVVDSVVASGIVERHDDDVLELRSGSWDPQLEEATRVYTTDPQGLMRAFTRIAMERIRGRAARTFADAFRIRKKGD
jgi:hypothetical protein